MRLATRVFLWSFVPVAFLLIGTFWDIQRLVQLTVREGIRSSLRHTHASIARVRSKSELQNSRFLRILGENASLKAGLQLLALERRSADARRTVEDQLREMCQTMGFDFLLVSDPEGGPLAGVLQIGEQLVSIDTAHFQPQQRGFLTIAGQAYQVASTPVNQGDENIGILSVGERFDFSDFSTPAVLTRNGKVLKSNIPGTPVEEVESAFKGCQGQAECEVRLRAETYVSLPMESINFGEGYLLRSLQSIDSANAPVQRVLRNVFLITGIGTLLATVIVSVLSSRSIVRPLAGVVSHLSQTGNTGLLPEFHLKPGLTPIHEIRELTDSFNRAARAIRSAQEGLMRAYVEFVESLASALDARDRYTAGHSRRVTELSCAIARKMEVTAAELDEVRKGALLHDIGKIGIPDSVLQKPEPLTHEEFKLIQQHPTIGRRILERVGGLKAYLPVVELHHENWNGSGYPWGLCGDATPLSARIVHVADAYDAMTTDRPYRRALSHDEAIRAVQQNAGTQFDPAIVVAFLEVAEGAGERGQPSGVWPPVEPAEILDGKRV